MRAKCHLNMIVALCESKKLSNKAWVEKEQLELNEHSSVLVISIILEEVAPGF